MIKIENKLYWLDGWSQWGKFFTYYFLSFQSLAISQIRSSFERLKAHKYEIVEVCMRIRMRFGKVFDLIVVWHRQKPLTSCFMQIGMQPFFVG